MDILYAIVSLGILLFSAILHEIAHGLAAERLGDPTARLEGRLTLNPKNHIDPIMSLALPLLLLISGSPIIIGAAKPVPVDPFNFRDGRKDLALVSLAGPLTNVAIAVVFSFVLKIFPLEIIAVVIRLNLLLAIFNLIPIPPLDGSKVFSLLLPGKYADAFLSLGTIGIFIVFFLLLSNGPLSLGSLISSLLYFSEKLLGLY
jgi:Zn-dependent protease